MTLVERLLALHRAFEEAELPHAFGGAISLAYWTEEPRGTRDVDVNVFVPSAEAARVLDALPDGVEATGDAAGALERDGQARLWWDETPVDVFLDYAPIHRQAAEHRREVPFAGAEIPVLGPVELAVFKAMFDRTRDWADIEAMLAAGSVEAGEVAGVLRTMVEDDDPRFERLAEARRRARET